MDRKRKYSMLVFSRYVDEREEEYLKWYSGQHIHDLLRIPGFIGCRFYRVSDVQMFGTKEDKQHLFLMIWDWETEDVDKLIMDIRARKADGQSQTCPAFTDQYNIICESMTEWIPSQRIAGMSVEEVSVCSRLYENCMRAERI